MQNFPNSAKLFLKRLLYWLSIPQNFDRYTHSIICIQQGYPRLPRLRNIHLIWVQTVKTNATENGYFMFVYSTSGFLYILFAYTFYIICIRWFLRFLFRCKPSLWSSAFSCCNVLVESKLSSEACVSTGCCFKVLQKELKGLHLHIG